MRVRHHGRIAVIEVASEELERVVHPASRRAILRTFVQLGFSYVALDLLGFWSGSL